jgi:hypothetical protein
MPRNCTACVHEQSAQITKDIAAGVSYRSISSQYGITVSAGQRHAVKCLRLVRSRNTRPDSHEQHRKDPRQFARVRSRQIRRVTCPRRRTVVAPRASN